MGAHYRSLQIQSDNRDGVIAIVENLARAHKAKFLIGPEIKGWIGVYPDDDVNAATFAAALAKELNAAVLDLMVYHSDVFYYKFYRGDQLLDDYCSRPDFFDKGVSAAERQRLRGKLEVFRELIGSDEKLAQLASLLTDPDKDKYRFEEDRMEAFADFLGIKNTFASYEYLSRGEWDGISGRKQFVHIPDLADEKAAARAAAAALRAEFKRLERERVLSFIFESKPRKRRERVTCEVTFDPSQGGILHGYKAFPVEPKLFYLKPPWTSEPEIFEAPMVSSVPHDPHHLMFSRTGKWLAYVDSHLRLWDWPGKKAMEGTDLRVTPLEFSPDEKFLLCENYKVIHDLKLLTTHGSKTFDVYSIEERKLIQSVPNGAEHSRFLAWHPSGRFIVTTLRGDSLSLIDLEAGKLIKFFCFGGMSGESKAATPEEQMVEWKKGSVRGNDQLFRLKFSPDGQRLFCGTSKGLCVLEWDKVLTAERVTPEPLIEVSPFPPEPPVPRSSENLFEIYKNHVSDVVFDENANRLLFCGFEGVVRFLNLNDRSTGILLKPPGKDLVLRIELSTDREYLCCHCSPPIDVKGKERTEPSRTHIWNYRTLRKAAGLEE